MATNAPIVPVRTFGAFAAAAPAQEARPEATAWLNIGYYSDPVQNPVTGEVERKFVSLPVGIPLDTQKPIDKRRMTPLMQAQNDLLETLQKAAAEMGAGDEREVQLVIQLRRVNEPTAPTADEAAPFAIKNPLFAVPASE